ncbi:MAG: AAA family ATPase [Candidatus Acidiferrales bacterium]|jgi:ABC-type branched-subunit amino acid transport system ATPase component
MKPIGIRFENFACFEECYVRLDEGIQILVGKNNAGKTAILRGLTALRGLPFGTHDDLPFNLGGYARGAATPADFTFHVECSFEESDFALLGGQMERWPQVRNSKNQLIDFDFRLLGVGNFVGLQGVTLNLDDRKIPLVQKESNAWIQPQYNHLGQTAGRVVLRETSERRGSSGETWPIFDASIFSALVPLKNARMIDAHRVARSEDGMRAVDELTPNVESLPSFLDTLNGSDRRKFHQVEDLVKRVFPELEFVNPQKKQTSVFLTLTGRMGGPAIPLTHCGTGVEQVLALGAFVLAAPTGSILLLDEPHSYLHPSAEREIINFLQEHSEHRYVISTHSAILINAVPPDRVFAVSSPRITRANRQQPAQTAALLHSLGYKNSDFLFSDRLIFVEGESDQEILPILLGRNPSFEKSDIARSGFPKMDGEGKLRGSAKQTPLLFFEKFLKELGKTSLPRIYLFDGDANEQDKQVVQSTPIIAESNSASIAFLPRCELENYLVVPPAIVQAIRQLADLEGKNISTLNENSVDIQIQELLSKENGKLFPDGKEGDPLRKVKGSIVLERVFATYELKYRKRIEGRLLAEYVTVQNQPALAEIWDCARPIFPKNPMR